MSKMTTSKYHIDEEMEIEGITYWCNAEIVVEWTRMIPDRILEASNAYVNDLKLFAYDPQSDAFEFELSDKRLLDKAGEMAKEWALENADLS